MSHYWLDSAVRAKIDKLASIGILCSSMVTMDEAQFSARGKKDFTFLTDLYSKILFWLPFDEDTEQKVAGIRAAMWRIGAGRGAQTTDVLIAATAIRHDAVVVHNGTDFVTLHRAVPELNHQRIVPSIRGDASAST